MAEAAAGLAMAKSYIARHDPRRVGRRGHASPRLVMGQVQHECPVLAPTRAARNKLARHAEIQPEQRGPSNQCHKTGADAGTTVLDRARLSRRQKPRRNGAVSGPSMAILAPSHGSGDDGYSVYARDSSQTR